MKKYLIVISSLIMCLTTYSQQGETWSLRECINYAIDHNIQVKQQELQVKNAEVDLSTSKNSRLPNLNATVGERFNFGRSISQESNTYESINTATTAWQATSSTPIFTGFKIPNDIKSKEYSLKAATEGLSKVKDNIEIQITSYYLDVLYKKELLKVYEEQAHLTNNQVEKTKILYEGGKVPLSQVYDIQSQLASDNLNITNAYNDLLNSLLLLSQALNLDYNVSFDIEKPQIDNIIIKHGALASLINPDEIYQRAIQIKPHVKEALYNIESSKKNLKVAQSGYWPSLNLELNYSNGYQKSYANPTSKFSDQIKNNRSEYIALSMSIPIFNRFETRNQVRKARIDILSKEFELDNVKQILYKEIQQAYQNAIAAESKFNSTTKANEAAAQSFKYASDRYQAGKISVFEYNESVTKLMTSQFEQVQSKYDFLFRTKILDFYQGVEISI